jgi:hypothetical protein
MGMCSYRVLNDNLLSLVLTLSFSLLLLLDCLGGLLVLLNSLLDADALKSSFSLSFLSFDCLVVCEML